MIEAYPLCWPAGYPRAVRQVSSRFKTSLGRARDFVKDEVRRIGGQQPVISTNIPLKQNGDLYADWGRYKIDDIGVAVYFTYKGSQVCLCCDQYTKIWDNLYAIGRTIAALRQISRDGVSDFLNRTFTGFKALPERASVADCWAVLGIECVKDTVKIKDAFYALAKVKHPDVGGSASEWIELNSAYHAALRWAEGV